MADNKQVLHFRRIKTIAGCYNVLTHNTRRKDNLSDFVDADKSRFNTYEGAEAEVFSERYQEMIDNAHLKRKIQKNASRIIEFVVSASHNYCKNWCTNPEEKEKLDAYFAESRTFLRNKYGDVIISTAIHFDETTPHMHVLCVPLVRNKTGEGMKFSSSEFVGGIKELQSLHTEYYEQVGKHFGLERGQEGSRTSHSELKEYKAWEQTQKIKLAALEQDAEDRRKTVYRKEMELAAFEKGCTAQTPVIPVPPAKAKEKEIAAWREAVQDKVSAAFKGILKRGNSLLQKFNDLAGKYNSLVKAYEEWKNRALKAERDLAEKPLEAIQAEREQQALQKIRRQNRQRGGFSR